MQSVVVESFVGSLTWDSFVVLSAALIVVDAVDFCSSVDGFSMLFFLPSGGCEGFDFCYC